MRIIATQYDMLKMPCVSVCVKGSKFKGILLQMRVVGKTDPVGTFDGAKGKLPNNTQLMNCSAEGDSVTHSYPTEKPSSACFIWKAPENKDATNLHFV